ncbi:MAG: hypothetical protein GY841_15885, partial [FCB group bacterium]|nr:hypothetical protein [FCB group bacterium]
VSFAMSKLVGKARAWAFGRLMSDSLIFPSYAVFKRDLMETFQPPQCEFRMSNRFLDISQGKRDLHTYVQEIRYLIANIVDIPVDRATQVSVFLKGLNPGSLKTQLFRKSPTSLDEAINEALREEFSVKQSKEHGSFPLARAGTRKNNTSFYRFPDSRERHVAHSYNRPKAHT